MDHIFVMDAITWCKNLINLENIVIVHIKENVYRICFLYMSKSEAKKLMTNLIDKKGVLWKIYFFSLYKKWIIQLIIKETEK